MAVLVDEAHLPAMLTVGPMTDEAFAELCNEHPDLSFELSSLGELIIMPPTYALTALRNHVDLRRTNRKHLRGGIRSVLARMPRLRRRTAIPDGQGPGGSGKDG